MPSALNLYLSTPNSTSPKPSTKILACRFEVQATRNLEEDGTIMKDVKAADPDSEGFRDLWFRVQGFRDLPFRDLGATVWCISFRNFKYIGPLRDAGG